MDSHALIILENQCHHRGPWTNETVMHLIEKLLWPRNVHYKVSYHLLKEPRTPHNAVNSGALPARNSKVVQSKIFLNDCSACRCDNGFNQL